MKSVCNTLVRNVSLLTRVKVYFNVFLLHLTALSACEYPKVLSKLYQKCAYVRKDTMN